MANNNQLKQSLNNQIMKVKGSERITKKELGDFSRSVMGYVYDSGDVGMINRMLEVLTPVNKRVAVLYFRHFVAWGFEESTNKFTDKMVGKPVTKKREAYQKFLAESEANNIWTWSESSVDIDKKPDFGKNITSSINRALKGDEKKGVEALTLTAVMASVLAADGVDISELFNALENFKSDKAA